MAEVPTTRQDTCISEPRRLAWDSESDPLGAIPESQGAARTAHDSCSSVPMEGNHLVLVRSTRGGIRRNAEPCIVRNCMKVVLSTLRGAPSPACRQSRAACNDHMLHHSSVAPSADAHVCWNQDGDSIRRIGEFRDGDIKKGSSTELAPKLLCTIVVQWGART